MEKSVTDNGQSPVISANPNRRSLEIYNGDTIPVRFLSTPVSLSSSSQKGLVLGPDQLRILTGVDAQDAFYAVSSVPGRAVTLVVEEKFI